MTASAIIAPGGRWSKRLETGDRLRIVDAHRQQAVDFLCFAASGWGATPIEVRVTPAS